MESQLARWLQKSRREPLVIHGARQVGKSTLLFLDEIQSTPYVIAALRYFRKEMSQLPVVAAGSLLEFVATFKGLGENYDKLKETYHWLSEQQIRSALSFYALYPDEIGEKITRNEDITQEQTIKRFPFLSKTAGKT